MPMEHEGSSTLNRRATLKGAAAGAAGMAGLSGATADAAPRQAKSVIFVFLTGGLSHHDTYDMKPDAPPEIRGEFKPVATKTPGIQISEHLPRMGKLSNTWSLLRSMETGSSGHENACHMMLTGRLDFPPGF
ncbi:MAG: DUF1501 domain-containing protein, partial [Pirellulaceae bacterium]|nr:DUF1501 domain-containing protein [Pirellulaceae bacterium]